MFSVFSDAHFMNEAYKEAQRAYEAGEVPVGAVVVCNQKIIARAHNQTERLNDVTAHAEMLAITAAATSLGAKYLKDCQLYVTLEPCLMCSGALNWAQLGALFYAVQDDKKGYTSISEDVLHKKTNVHFGLMEMECKALLKQFFLERRQ